jgi:hypothetical protein
VDLINKKAISDRAYRQSKKGKKTIAKINRRYSQKQKAITVYFRGEDEPLYQIFLKLKGDKSNTEMALNAIREWIIRNA